MATHLALVSTLAPDTRFEALVVGGAGTNCTKYFEIYLRSSPGDNCVDPGDLDPYVQGDDPGVREGGVISGERTDATGELEDVFDPGV